MLDGIFDFRILGVPLAFLWTSLVIELTPGPNMTYLAVLSATEGRRAGLSAVAGVATGLAIVGIVAAFGLGVLISESAILYATLRWAGVAYLLWLAYETWTGTGGHRSDTHTFSNHDWKYFKNGLITNLLNPKAAIFYIAVLPMFILPDRAVLQQTLALTVAYVVVATFVHAAIAMLAAAARPFLENETKIEKLRRLMALALVLVALWVVWSTGRAPSQCLRLGLEMNCKSVNSY